MWIIRTEFPKDDPTIVPEVIYETLDLEGLCKGSTFEKIMLFIWVLSFLGGGSKPLPGWFGALFYYQNRTTLQEVPEKSAPECPFECGGLTAILAMPKKT